MNMTVVNNDLGGSIIDDAEFQDDIITFAGADTFAAGTILARDSVSELLVLYVKGGVANENGIPKVILTYDVTAVGAGNINARVAVSGKYRKEKLMIDVDGDDSNIDQPVKDQLRDYGLVPLNVDELNIQDNQ